MLQMRMPIAVGEQMNGRGQEQLRDVIVPAHRFEEAAVGAVMAEGAQSFLVTRHKYESNSKHDGMRPQTHAGERARDVKPGSEDRDPGAPRLNATELANLC